ncbi:MAG: cation transporter [Nocardioidaceae bacterium]|nr:cation transporter [Nocardioidaceae bacterium]NUS51930.1 cation transporter [Nocardioidaceae bacterium]
MRQTVEHPHHDHGHVHGHGHGHRGGLVGLLSSVFRPHSHDASDSVDDALSSSARGIRALKVSLLALLATGLLQAVVTVSTGSVALLADTIHNVTDAFTAVPLGIAFWLGRRPPTRRFTYGYGRAEDLAGVVVVLVIAGSAVVAGWEAFRRLLHPAPVEHVGWVAAAGVIGFVGNELVAIYRIRVGRDIGSAALVADGLHARTDGITSLAVVLGAVGVALGWPLADPIVGLAITAAIVAVLWGAARDVFGRLMDAVDPAMTLVGQRALEETDGVRSVPQVRLRWSGHQLHADATVDVDPHLSVDQAHDVVHAAERNLTRALPKVSAAVIHAHPAAPPRSGAR